MLDNKSNYGSKFESKVGVTGNENVKIVFCLAYMLVESGSICQAKTKMISGPVYTYRLINFTTENASFCGIYPSVCLYLTYLSFTQYWNMVGNFSGKLSLTIANGAV